MTRNCNRFKLVSDPLKAGIPFRIDDEGFYFHYFCMEDNCEVFCHLSMEGMLEGDFSLKPTDEYYLYGAENLKNEITIVNVHYKLYGTLVGIRYNDETIGYF